MNSNNRVANENIKIYTIDDEEPCCAFCFFDNKHDFCKGCGPGSGWTEYKRIVKCGKDLNIYD